MRKYINILLMPAVFIWLVGSLVLPILHAISTYLTDVTYYENLLLQFIMFSVILGVPLAAINYFSDFNFKSVKNILTNTKKEGCSSCKKKKTV